MEPLDRNLEIWDANANSSDTKAAAENEELAATKAEHAAQLIWAKELWNPVKQDNLLLESEARMLNQAVKMLQNVLDQHLFGFYGRFP